MITLKRTKQWESFEEKATEELRSLNNETESGALQMMSLKDELKSDLEPFIEILEMEMEDYKTEVMKDGSSFSDRRRNVKRYDILEEILKKAKYFYKGL